MDIFVTNTRPHTVIDAKKYKMTILKGFKNDTLNVRVICKIKRMKIVFNNLSDEISNFII